MYLIDHYDRGTIVFEFSVDISVLGYSELKNVVFRKYLSIIFTASILCFGWISAIDYFVQVWKSTNSVFFKLLSSLTLFQPNLHKTRFKLLLNTLWDII